MRGRPKRGVLTGLAFLLLVAGGAEAVDRLPRISGGQIRYGPEDFDNLIPINSPDFRYCRDGVFMDRDTNHFSPAVDLEFSWLSRNPQERPSGLPARVWGQLSSEQFEPYMFIAKGYPGALSELLPVDFSEGAFETRQLGERPG